jgi:hypothetical protein
MRLDGFTAALKRRAVFMLSLRDALIHPGMLRFGASLFAGFVRRPPSRPEAKASGHPIPKPHE